MKKLHSRRNLALRYFKTLESDPAVLILPKGDLDILIIALLRQHEADKRNDARKRNLRLIRRPSTTERTHKKCQT